MNPYLQDADLTLYQGDALEVLRQLPDESVHMCVTSPPFYGLRDYGTGRWEGGNPDCDHVVFGGGPPESSSLDGAKQRGRSDVTSSPCPKCGASRVDQQIGLEETPEQWVAALVAVFREVRRVLRRDGTCWVEVGDSYASSPPGIKTAERYKTSTISGPPPGLRKGVLDPATADKLDTSRLPGLKPKDLIGAPWMLAFALRADGWYLRSDVVWSRPNPMPESVTDRPTKSHSYVFLLSKLARYFFDQEAIREPLLPQSLERGYTSAHLANGLGQKAAANPDRNNAGESWTIPSGRNVRSVWSIPTQAYSEAHFATFPEELVRRCILAGSSERGCCPECGAPWEREVEKGEPVLNAWSANGAAQYDDAIGGMRPTSLEEGSTLKHIVPRETIGWVPTCDHFPSVGAFRIEPCTVLDPFAGSGTTGLVARKHGRRSILIELSSEYCELVARRTQQLSLEAEPA